jgi:hypothetical protein
MPKRRYRATRSADKGLEIGRKEEMPVKVTNEINEFNEETLLRWSGDLFVKMRDDPRSPLYVRSVLMGGKLVG